MGVLIDPLTDPATGFHQQLDEVFHSSDAMPLWGRAAMDGSPRAPTLRVPDEVIADGLVPCGAVRQAA